MAVAYAFSGGASNPFRLGRDPSLGRFDPALFQAKDIDGRDLFY